MNLRKILLCNFFCALACSLLLSSCVTTVTKKTSGYRPVATPATDSNKAPAKP